MSLTIADQYYLKALDEYPYDLESVIENLNYALSYEGDHADANCLMGSVYMEQFKQYDISEEYFIEAMASDPTNLKTCEAYTRLMIDTNQSKNAFKLIQHAKKLKGCDLGKFIWFEALAHERLKDYEKSIELLNEAMFEAYQPHNIDLLEDELKRVRQKISLSKKIQYKMV